MIRGCNSVGRRLLIIVLVTFGLCADLSAQAVNNASPNIRLKEKIRSLDKQWAEALPREDTKTLKRILGNGYVFTGTKGKMFTKTDFMRISEDNHLLSLKTDDIHLSMYKDTIILNGRATLEFVDRTEMARYTNVYVKILVSNRELWLLVATQFTRVADDEVDTYKSL